MLSQSNVERAFIRGLDEYRTDGRTPDEGRKRSVKVSRNKSTGQTQCEVALGDTVCLAVVNATAVAPFQDRPNEGLLRVSVILSSLARQDWDTTAKPRTKEASVVNSVLENAILESKAVDLEGLCILSGRKVWSIQVDICVLNDAGNVIDCSCLAAFGALSHFRRPDVDIVGESVKIYSVEEREPVPISLHHTPLCFTFALFRPTPEEKEKLSAEKLAEVEERRFFLLDPTDREELSCDGQITIVVNSHKEVCGIHKHGWPPLNDFKISKLLFIASELSPQLAKDLL